MRKPILPFVLGLMACSGDGAPAPAVIVGFLDRTRAVDCERVELTVGPAVTELRMGTDTTFLVLDDPGRQVLEFDHDLRLLWHADYPASGPASAEAAVSAALLGDTAVAIAGRAGLRLVVIGRDGELIRSSAMDFIPNSIEATPDGAVLVTPMALGDKPPTLLQRFDGGEFRSVDVRPRPYDDMMIRALGNAALVEVLPDGGALLVHQYLAPRAFHVGPDGAVSDVAMPVPDATAASASFIPTAPITEDQMPRLMIPAMAMSVDPLRSEVYVLTRSGRTVDGRPERALLRLDDRLNFLDAFTLNVPAGAMVYLPHRRTALVVDEEDAFHACPLAPAGGPEDRAE